MQGRKPARWNHGHSQAPALGVWACTPSLGEPWLPSCFSDGTGELCPLSCDQASVMHASLEPMPVSPGCHLRSWLHYRTDPC